VCFLSHVPAGQFDLINAANLKRAHPLIESGKAIGKIVLKGW
jgi:NADPH2:quinone reductase